MNVTAQTEHVSNVASAAIESYTQFSLALLSEYSLKIVGAILIFLIGKWIIKKVTKILRLFMLKAKVDKTLLEFSASLAYFVLLLMVIMASLNALGINTTSFITVLGAATLAVGMALKGSLSNIGAAVIIIVFRPFQVGDSIDAAGATGKVTKITLFSTTIMPADNRSIIIPNASITGGNITNFSSQATRRVDHTFSIGYEDDLRLAKTTLMEIVSTDDRILKEPAPFVAVSELADSSVNFTVHSWTKTEDYWSVYFSVIEKVKLTFDERGISIPYPQVDMHQK